VRILRLSAQGRHGTSVRHGMPGESNRGFEK